MAPDNTNYVSYVDPGTNRARIGHLNLEDETILPLSFKSGAPISDLYQLIEAGEEHISVDRDEEPFPSAEVKILPPISGRDILAVGKNYFEHAKEFNRSGFDSSDKVDVPTHPVIFTKRATSIIAQGEHIYHHPEFTQSLDYEGEIGVIIGKPASRVTTEQAMDYVWGYTIINDVTARERQRDHKQFFIGKSGDTFCPMGPIAKPAKHLPKVLRVQTVVNGEPQQDATTEDLIFSIPFLIKTLSEGLTLQPGDVIATGTPAGVGIGKTPPVFLKPGDTITISVTGLGTLSNTVTATPPAPIAPTTTPPTPSLLFHATSLGSPSSPPILLLPALGTSPSTLHPLITALSLPSTHSIHLLSLSPGLSPLTTPSLAAALSPHLPPTPTPSTLLAHSTAALPALALARAHPSLVTTLVLLNPVPAPLPATRRRALRARAKAIFRAGGRVPADVLDALAAEETGSGADPLAVAAVRMAVEAGGEGYARACRYLAEAEEGEGVFSGVEAEVVVVVGGDDGVAEEGRVREWVGGRAEVRVLEGVGHWSVLEDVRGVAGVVKEKL